MNEKDKAPEEANIFIEGKGKGNHNFIKYKILSVLKSEKCTAIQLNERFGHNDSRKRISELRRDGYRVADFSLPGGQKVYFIKPDGQLDLFKKGGSYA